MLTELIAHHALPHWNKWHCNIYPTEVLDTCSQAMCEKHTKAICCVQQAMWKPLQGT